MKNKRFIISLAGAVIFGLIATVTVTRYLANVQAQNDDLGKVVVARINIPLGAKVAPEQVDLVPMPNGSAPEGAFNSLDKVVGRIAITPIGVREAVTNSKLASEGAAGGLSAAIPEGFRAMTVSVNDIIGVSGFIMPGSFVDVICVITPVDQSANQGPISKIVLQNIKILANGTNIDQPKDGREAASNVRAVTLLVSPDQAEKLALATSEGRLQLVMRNYGDQEDANTQGANKRSLLTGINAPIIVEPANSAAPKVPAFRPVSYPSRRSVMPMEVNKTAPPAIAPSPARAARSSVEVIEGAKKRNVDIP